MDGSGGGRRVGAGKRQKGRDVLGTRDDDGGQVRGDIGQLGRGRGIDEIEAEFLRGGLVKDDADSEKALAARRLLAAAPMEAPAAPSPVVRVPT